MEMRVESKLICLALSSLWGALRGQSCYQEQNCPCKCVNLLRVDALFLYTGTTLIICGSLPKRGTFFQRATSNSYLLARTLQTCHFFPSTKAPTMLQQKRQKSLHLANLWGRQKTIFSPLLQPIWKVCFVLNTSIFKASLTMGMAMSMHNGMFMQDFLLGVDIDFL